MFTHSPIFRIGGDEFIAILTGEDLKQSHNLLKKLREGMVATRNAAFPWKHISIAYGIDIAQSAKDTTIAETFNKADKNMYKNKRAIKLAEQGQPVEEKKPQS